MGVNEIDFAGLNASNSIQNGLRLGTALGGKMRDNRIQDDELEQKENERALNDAAKDAAWLKSLPTIAEQRRGLELRIQRGEALGRDMTDSKQMLALPDDQFTQELDYVYNKAAPLVSDKSFQFGAQQTFKDSKNNLFFGTQRRDPQTGQVVSALSPVGTAQEPVGELKAVNGLGLTADENVDQKGKEAGAVTDAKNTSDLDKKPLIESEVTRARMLVESEVNKAISQRSQVSRFEQGLEIANTLLPKGLDDLSVLSKIYGKGESLYPNALRSQAGIDAIAERDRFVNMLALGARGELKGQGPITDGETVMLEKAITILKEPDISPKLAARYIQQGMDILGANAGRAVDVANPTPKTNSGNASTFTSKSGITFEVN